MYLRSGCAAKLRHVHEAKQRSHLRVVAIVAFVDASSIHNDLFHRRKLRLHSETINPHIDLHSGKYNCRVACVRVCVDRHTLMTPPASSESPMVRSVLESVTCRYIIVSATCLHLCAHCEACLIGFEKGARCFSMNAAICKHEHSYLAQHLAHVASKSSPPVFSATSRSILRLDCTATSCWSSPDAFGGTTTTLTWRRGSRSVLRRYGAAAMRSACRSLAQYPWTH